MTPICLSPMKQIKAPIPALMARRRSSGIDLITQTRKLVNESTVKSAPLIATMPSALCHGIFASTHNAKVKYAFSPMPTLSATGVFAKSPLNNVAIIVISAVAVTSASNGIPAMLIMLAFTGTM